MSLHRSSAAREFEIVTAALQDHLSGAPAPDWDDLLVRSVDWRRVLAMCRFHEVTPLVYESLRPKLSPDVLSPLRAQVLASARHSFNLVRALKELLTELEAQNIAAVPLKGVLLSERLFGDVAIRPTKDIDLIVKEGDYARAKGVLLENGYRGPLDDAGKPVARDPVRHNAFHHATFCHAASGHYLELHTRLMPLGMHDRLQIEQFWTALVRQDWGGQRLWTLPEDLLFLTLALHAGKHGWKRLKWLFDLSYLLDTVGLPGSLLAKAKASDGLRSLACSAALSRELFALSLPSGARELERVSSSAPVRIALRQFRRWPHPPLGAAEKLLFHLCLSERPTLRSGFHLLRGKVKRDYGI